MVQFQATLDNNKIKAHYFNLRITLFKSDEKTKGSSKLPACTQQNNEVNISFIRTKIITQ